MTKIIFIITFLIIAAIIFFIWRTNKKTKESFNGCSDIAGIRSDAAAAIGKLNTDVLGISINPTLAGASYVVEYQPKFIKRTNNVITIINNSTNLDTICKQLESVFGTIIDKSDPNGPSYVGGMAHEKINDTFDNLSLTIVTNNANVITNAKPGQPKWFSEPLSIIEGAELTEKIKTCAASSPQVQLANITVSSYTKADQSNDRRNITNKNPSVSNESQGGESPAISSGGNLSIVNGNPGPE
jgi:hypothetical protein